MASKIRKSETLTLTSSNGGEVTFHFHQDTGHVVAHSSTIPGCVMDASDVQALLTFLMERVQLPGQEEAPSEVQQWKVDPSTGCAMSLTGTHLWLKGAR